MNRHGEQASIAHLDVSVRHADAIAAAVMPERSPLHLVPGAEFAETLEQEPVALHADGEEWRRCQRLALRAGTISSFSIPPFFFRPWKR